MALETSFIKVLDEGVKALLLSKFGTYLGIDDEVKDIVFFPKDVAQRTISEKRGEVQTEFISVWRDELVFDWNRQRSPLARHGMNLHFNDVDKTTVVNMKAVPVTIDYTFWLWSRSLDKIMQASEAYLFWQHVNPNMTLSYDDAYSLDFDLHFGSIVDESTTSQQFEKGMHFIYRYTLKVDGWVLLMTTPKTILSILLTVWYNETLSTATQYNSQKLAQFRFTESGMTREF